MPITDRRETIFFFNTEVNNYVSFGCWFDWNLERVLIYPFHIISIYKKKNNDQNDPNDSNDLIELFCFVLSLKIRFSIADFGFESAKNNNNNWWMHFIL